MVNCVSTLALAQTQALIKTPVMRFKAIPLTPIALHLGPIAFTPPPRNCAACLTNSALRLALRSLAVVTAQIAHFYTLQATIQRWLENHGLAAKEAKGYVGSMFHALATLATADQAPSFETLLSEAETPGGLNEQTLLQLQEAGWLGQLEASLEAIQLARASPEEHRQYSALPETLIALHSTGNQEQPHDAPARPHPRQKRSFDCAMRPGAYCATTGFHNPGRRHCTRGHGAGCRRHPQPQADGRSIG